MRTEDITALCNRLISTIDHALLQIAAEKQLALSSITNHLCYSGACTELVRIDAITKVVIQFDVKASSAGFTPCELDEALCAIRVAGQAALHLSVISKPITDAVKPASDAILKRVMYGGSHKGVKTQPASFKRTDIYTLREHLNRDIPS